MCIRDRVENDDLITFLVKYENGAIGDFSSSRVATGRKNYFYYEIQGTEGSVVYDLERMCEVQEMCIRDSSRTSCRAVFCPSVLTRIYPIFMVYLSFKYGIMKIIRTVTLMDKTIEQVKQLAHRCGVPKLILFGSRARGDHHARSDYDFAIWGCTPQQRAQFSDAVENDLDSLYSVDLVFVLSLIHI